MLLARDSIVGIFIPSSISLPASLFTRSVIHHLVTNSLVICLQAYDVYYQEGPKIPLRYSEWQILISIYANSTSTIGDTCRASLWSPSYVVTFDSTQGSCGIRELHNLIVKGICIWHEESNSNKLNDHYVKLTDGSCPSHHSPNDVIPLSNDNSCPWLGNLNHLWSTS